MMRTWIQIFMDIRELLISKCSGPTATALNFCIPAFSNYLLVMCSLMYSWLKQWNSLNQPTKVLCHYISDGSSLIFTNVFTLINFLVCMVPSGWNPCDLPQKFKEIFQITDLLFSVFLTYIFCHFSSWRNCKYVCFSLVVHIRNL